MEEEQKTENETEKNLIWGVIDWIVKTKENIVKAGAVLAILSGLVFWISKDKEPEIVGETKDFVMEHKECLHDDIIVGEIQVKGKIKKAALCSLTVFSKFKKDFKTVISNEITKQDGTFKFSFCKATTAYVEFSVNDFKHDEYIKPYPVDSIPNIVDFQ
jgi:hypothetical protein